MGFFKGAKMKKNKIAVAIYDCNTNDVVDQKDYNVPDIFNVFDVCDFCEESTNCKGCIVGALQTDSYFVEELLPCPFCGTKPIREISNNILRVRCPKCVSVGFHTHIRFGCLADTKWNTRTLSSKEAKNV